MAFISVPQIVSICFTAFLCFALPITLFIVVKRRTKYLVGALIAGILSFYIPQVLIRIPVIQIISQKIDLENILETSWLYKVIYALIMGITAGLFEEAGRLFSMKLLLKDEKRTYKSGIVHGIGHGGFEAILLVGLNYIFMTVMGIGLLRSGLDSKIISGLPLEVQDIFLVTFRDTPWYLFIVAGIERGLTLAIHIAISLMIMEGIVRKQIPKFFVISVLVHTILDSGSVLLSFTGISIWFIEGFVLLFAIGSIYYIMSSRKRFGDRINPTDEADASVEEGY